MLKQENQTSTTTTTTTASIATTKTTKHNQLLTKKLGSLEDNILNGIDFLTSDDYSDDDHSCQTDGSHHNNETQTENEDDDENNNCNNNCSNQQYRGYHKFSYILGKGSFGQVVECKRISDDKLVALKFLKYGSIHKWVPVDCVQNDIDDRLMSSSEFFRDSMTTTTKTNGSIDNQQRFIPSEVACLLKASKIPGIVKLVDYLPANGSDINDETLVGIVLEREIDEVCLFDYLHARICLDESEAKLIMKQIVEASIELLHDGILHGDIKSENILINPVTKNIKIIDFGSAQLLTNNNKNETKTNDRYQNVKYISISIRLIKKFKKIFNFSICF
jgi:hypothetical protein